MSKFKFEEQFRAENPQTIGEADSHFDLDNYKDWLESKLEWVSVDEKLPENADEVQLKNIEWITSYNSNGIRNGYLESKEKSLFCSSFWNEDCESYDISYSKPTHWRSFL
jgi:hypothetical protein